jgi:hypothetical protein
MIAYVLAAVLALLAGGFLALATVAWTVPAAAAALAASGVCAWISWVVLRDEVRRRHDGPVGYVSDRDLRRLRRRYSHRDR